MKRSDPVDREIEENLKRLNKTQKATLYFELLFRLALYRLSELWRNVKPRPRSRIHWVGHAGRPRRPERLLFVVLFFVAMLVFEPLEYLIWSITWGALFSIGINIYMGYKLLRRRAHWL